MTEMRGTDAAQTEKSILAPWRMMPVRSTSAPTMKPALSARKSSGTLKALHIQMKRAALSELSENSTPALWSDWLASTPMGRPPSRANPQTSSGAKRSL